MFAIQPPSNQSSSLGKESVVDNCMPNVLPCRIHHDGPVENIERYWNPAIDEKANTQIAHFRGRKLCGRRVALPEGYQGIVTTRTDNALPSAQKDKRGTALEDDNVDTRPEEPVKILEKQATFDEFVVWGHEVVPAADDCFVKGVEEWVKFAEAILRKNMKNECLNMDMSDIVQLGAHAFFHGWMFVLGRSKKGPLHGITGCRNKGRLID